MARLTKKEIETWKKPAKSPKALLERMRRLFSDSNRWIKGAFAEFEGDGLKEDEIEALFRRGDLDPRRATFCLVGGMECVRDGTDSLVVLRARGFLLDAINDDVGDDGPGWGSIPEYNDDENITIKSVRAALDRAIVIAAKRQRA